MYSARRKCCCSPPSARDSTHLAAFACVALAGSPRPRFNRCVLASLLPGLREIRAPLAAGYLWLAFAWLLAREHLPAAANATGLLDDVYALAALVGTTACLAAVSFVAYLVGALSGTMTELILSRLAARPFRMPGTDHVPGKQFERAMQQRPRVAITSRGGQVLRDAVVGAVAKTAQAEKTAAAMPAPGADRIPDRPGTPRFETVQVEFDHPPPSVTPRRAEAPSAAVAEARLRDRLRSSALVMENLPAVAADLPLMPIRLMGADAELFGTYDRQRAEAEFRAAVCLPVAALAIPLAFVAHPAWLLLLLFSVAFGGQCDPKAARGGRHACRSSAGRTGQRAEPGCGDGPPGG